MNYLEEIVRRQKRGEPVGIWSCCSANQYVIRAAMKRARERGCPVLIEATANQVNQDGGYTGMRPADFKQYVYAQADEMGLPHEQILLGGDHLGPLTWSHLPEQEAMEKAEALIRAYVEAGFEKIHIDTSMYLADDSREERLADAVIAARGARLCRVAEETVARCGVVRPVYVIGSEVPIPGGAQEEENTVAVTRPQACREMIDAFAQAFAAEGIAEAMERVIAVVVQPGVEFGSDSIVAYDSAKAQELTAVLDSYDHLVFEGHSTDYQTREALRSMVKDGIAILKVGPALTFAFREALFALENMEKELLGGTGAWMSSLKEVLTHEMVSHPAQWEKHYHGNVDEIRFALCYSLSDRARYYLPTPAVHQSVERLLHNLEGRELPMSLISQYMPLQYQALRAHRIQNTAEDLILDHICNYIDDYLYACTGEGEKQYA